MKKISQEPVRGIRFPKDLWETLKRNAVSNQRTISKEIIYRLLESLKKGA